MQARERLDDEDMKRDMDLVRRLLIGLEDDERLDGAKSIRPSPGENSLGVLDDSNLKEVRYNLRLLIEAGFVEGNIDIPDGPAVKKLTWSGHELAANIRDKDVWARVKERLRGLPSIAISVMAEIAKAVRKHVGLP